VIFFFVLIFCLFNSLGVLQTKKKQKKKQNKTKKINKQTFDHQVG
jgi:hypothetical protein